jgi:hypothetical protein
MTSKFITDLSADIYSVLDSDSDHEPTPKLAADYAMRIGGELAKSTLKRDKPREKGKLWASDLGKPCMRQHWYKFNEPHHAAPLTGNTKFKFLYGNILEEAVLYMAEEAGHEVLDAQARVEGTIPRPHPQLDWQVTGRIDGLVDGVLIDVKSTSSFGFQRYKDGINSTNDSFGYLWQLGFYKHFGTFTKNPKDNGFLWIDKQNGHIKYTACTLPSKTDIVKRATAIASAVEQDSVDNISRAYAPEPYGKSGNLALATACSYCDFKKECWKKSNGGRGLRTFKYGHKPVHFTTVMREPRVPELTKE